MQTNTQVECLYCGNPNPTVKVFSTREIGIRFGAGSGGISGDISYREEWNLRLTPEITCDFCGRKYKLIADSTKVDFLRNVLSKMAFSDALIDIMDEFGISLDNVENGFVGISFPKGFISSIKRKTIGKKEFHIIFMSGERRYYMTFYKSRDQMVAVNVERV
ncbi:MAG: hypothetical protein H0Z28_08285 [Archaeoglobus sp.]|nr:hypothetical protein [Archaeoglobus sp.]